MIMALLHHWLQKSFLRWLQWIFLKNNESKKLIIFPVILFLILFTVGMLLSNVIQTENPKFTLPDIGLQSCLVWYDGCNTCTIMTNPDGIEDFVFTVMTCSEYEKSMCLDLNPWMCLLTFIDGSKLSCLTFLFTNPVIDNNKHD